MDPWLAEYCMQVKEVQIQSLLSGSVNPSNAQQWIFRHNQDSGLTGVTQTVRLKG